MELIRKTRKEKNKNGRWIYYGEFLCEFDNKIVEKILSKGKKQKSCGCQTGKEISESKKGKKFTESHRKNIALSKIGKKRTDISKNKQSETIKGEKHSMYGRHHTEEAKSKIKQSLGDMGGKNNPMFGKKHTEDTKNRQSKNKLGIKRTEESKNKQSETNIKNGIFKGENNPMYGKYGELSGNWNNGSSFEPYSPEFNKELKQQVLERDNYTCQCPDCEGVSKVLHAHHIDYNKKNNNPENIIILCNSCHAKTNLKNRSYWSEFYQNIMINRIFECLL